MEKLIKLHFTVALVFLTGAAITEAYFNVAQTDATPQPPQYATDYNDNGISEQIQQEARAKAKAQWREENGIYQANLTPQVNADMYRYIEQKQAEINRTWSKQ